MPASVAVAGDEVRIRPTGWAAVAAVERERRLPPAAVRGMTAGRFAAALG
ncbi:MAG: hypothetical protein ACRDNA_06740 [Gaiellaceae bacterium]